LITLLFTESDGPFIAKDACEAATEFVGKNIDDHLMLMNINNRSWLKDTFEKTYKVKINND
jgi:hypothetical protein